ITVSTTSRLAKSFPNTSSELVSRVMSNRRIVLRSFSWATAAAVSRAEKSVAKASTTGARNEKASAANRAEAPTVTSECLPGRICQQVHHSATRAMRAMTGTAWNCARRGAVVASRVKTGPTINVVSLAQLQALEDGGLATAQDIGGPIGSNIGSPPGAGRAA